MAAVASIAPAAVAANPGSAATGGAVKSAAAVAKTAAAAKATAARTAGAGQPFRLDTDPATGGDDTASSKATSADAVKGAASHDKDSDRAAETADPVSAVLAMLNGVIAAVAPGAIPPAASGNRSTPEGDAEDASGHSTPRPLAGLAAPTKPAVAAHAVTTDGAPNSPATTAPASAAPVKAEASRVPADAKPKPVAEATASAPSQDLSRPRIEAAQPASGGRVALPTWVDGPRQVSAAAAAAAGPSPTVAPGHSPTRELSLDGSDWTQGLYDHVHWQVDAGVSQASIVVHPRELGSVHVQVRMTPDGVDVQFAASQAQVRDTLAANLPQLRSLFGVDGLALAQTGVGSQPSRQQREASPSSGDRRARDAAEGIDAVSPVRSVVRIGLLDAFA